MSKDEIKRTDCAVRDGLFVEPCETLAEVVNNSTPAFSTRKGVAVWNMVKRDGGKVSPSRTFFGLIAEAHPKGILFNNCPFCGVDISAPFSKNDEEDAS